MSHTCHALILHCIDFRLGRAIKSYLEKNNLLDDTDIVAVAGAVKNLVDPKEPTDAEFVLRQIDISKRLHGIKEIILMNHTDCGAYGGDDTRHEEHLQKAKAMISAKYPDLKIETVLAKIIGSQVTIQNVI